jgi:preprotein translocase subunit SecG
MYPFFVALHVLLCVFLMLIIMLQPGKGGDISAAFGGGGAGSTMFGPRGPTGLLQRATTVVAVMFMGTTITLALYSHRGMLDNANVDEQLQRLQEMERMRNQSGAPSDAEPPAPSDAPSDAPELVAPIEVPPPGGDAP